MIFKHITILVDTDITIILRIRLLHNIYFKHLFNNNSELSQQKQSL